MTTFTSKEMGNRGVGDSVSDQPITGSHHIPWSDGQRAQSARDLTPHPTNWESLEFDVSVGWSS